MRYELGLYIFLNTSQYRNTFEDKQEQRVQDPIAPNIVLPFLLGFFEP
jgi:hypothetical protein